jgi:mono/diheme cytochrome c family protein
MTRWRFPVLPLAILAPAVAVACVAWWRGHDIGPVRRGFTVAAARGCLSCHGAGGSLADPDGTRGIGAVPSFDREDVTAYAKSATEMREWILDGRPRRLRDGRDDEPPPLLRMPAWRGVLSEREVEDLVAYVRAVSDFDPLPATAAAGRETAARLGCFACHGPQGRGDTPNPGSLKGHIPSWSGSDFAELVRDEEELREWIRDGAPQRLRANPVAWFFLRRQAIRMPAFGDRVSEEEIRDITAYIRCLRGGCGRPPASR